MAGKLLHSLTDDNPDLQKQIGCMTGIFHVFERHHALSTRRLTNKRLPPPGNMHFNNGNVDIQSNNVYRQQSTTDMSLSRSMNEKQRFSMESSRGSSFLSTLDCNKTTQSEASSFDRIIFPETPSRDPVVNQQCVSPHVGQQSVDLRDVVKDSMYREARGLSSKTTTKDNMIGCGTKLAESPRPTPLLKLTDESRGIGTNGKKNVPIDFQESLRVLAKLREAPWYFDEPRELPRSSSYEARDGLSISKDAPRFSYDGRERNRASFESRDTFKATPKLKEMPRLSLDSREGTTRGSNSDLKYNYPEKKLQTDSGHMDALDAKVPNPPQSLGTHNRPPSVVAKLMGLEALPFSTSATDSQLGFIKTSYEDRLLFPKSLKTDDPIRPIQISGTPGNSLKEPTSARRRSPDSFMKPISSSRFPIEPAPWKHVDGSRGNQKPASKPAKVPVTTTNTYPSVYSAIDKRLKDIEFKQSGKNLRALKQILEAMQAKGFLDTRKEDQPSILETRNDYEPDQNPQLFSQHNPQSTRATSMTKGADMSRTFESPIVIMKPAKLLAKSGTDASSVTSIDGFSRNRNCGAADTKRYSSNSRTARDQASIGIRRDSTVITNDKKTGNKNVRSTQSSTRTKPSADENSNSSVKSSGSVSPKLLQKKLEVEKQSRPPMPPSDLNKPRRHSSRQPAESGSPGGKLRQRSPNMQQNEDQLSEISNESRSMSYQGDELSLQAENSIVMDPEIDIEITSPDRPTQLLSGQSPTIQAAKKSNERLSEKGSYAELASASAEHRSHVSVSVASGYREDAPSPIKQILNCFEGDWPQSFKDKHANYQWSPASNLLSNSMESGPTSEITRKKLQNIEHLVQKLRRLNSNHDESNTDYIASLCENTNPDHRYISEILLASGILLRDLGSGLTTVQLHPSGHPINPELFYVLEQTKVSTPLSREESTTYIFSKSKSTQEKFHRKLIFDVVNEILVRKLNLGWACHVPWLKPYKLTNKTPTAQKLLKELCAVIEKLQAKTRDCTLEEEVDGLKSILWEDVMHRSESWTDVKNEISGLVLDIERSIFKELVDEIVIGRMVSFRASKQGK